MTQQQTTLHASVADTCERAGLGVMIEILEIVQDREDTPQRAFLSLTVDDIGSLYEEYIGPAIDKIERVMKAVDHG